ncbi:hypothetical protein [Saccharothrix luteola]|uniref:hypothetical protein n=1 Tax=Saccharothrix luteola TaxID=2893018 RepID=UPI001E415124|nr:hypothetical protein [Saccharothrix luteola]MCC8251527.1 hypothetical protein [Saccharothrix luteola]
MRNVLLGVVTSVAIATAVVVTGAADGENGVPEVRPQNALVTTNPPDGFIVE